MMLSSVKASSRSRLVRATAKSIARRAASSVASFNARTDTGEVERPALGDNRPLEFAVVHEIDASPNFHAAFDPGPGDDPVADRGVRISKED